MHIIPLINLMCFRKVKAHRRCFFPLTVKCGGSSKCIDTTNESLAFVHERKERDGLGRKYKLWPINYLATTVYRQDVYKCQQDILQVKNMITLCKAA
jgi:hypothetical protein